nr:hypothetical protein L204_02008 [Cryptococcus depauperatus CBS 7855]
MLLANYASDSGSDSELEAPVPTLSPKSTLKPNTSSNSTPAAPNRKKRVKITLDLPKPAENENSDDDSGKEAAKGGAENERERETKRPRLLKGGKGGSSLLGMLPAPKRKLPQAASSSSSKGASLNINKTMARPQLPAPPGATEDEKSDEETATKSDGILLPASLARKKQSKKEKEPLDLFGLTSAPAPKAPSFPMLAIKPPTISSAPVAPDFVPPEPTASDPYPGYYELPSGEWRAYDTEYYQSFFPSSTSQQVQDDANDGRVGKHWDAFEKGQFKGHVVEIDANKGLAEARAEAERRELMKKPKIGDDFVYQVRIHLSSTRSCPLMASQPKGQIKGLASQRHQLTALLNTAYTQREELEERIAANKKGMRAAGTKYGF